MRAQIFHTYDGICPFFFAVYFFIGVFDFWVAVAGGVDGPGLYCSLVKLVGRHPATQIDAVLERGTGGYSNSRANETKQGELVCRVFVFQVRPASL